MTPHDELKPSWVKLKDMQEHINDLEQLIQDFNTLMQEKFAYTWNSTSEGIKMQQRMRELIRTSREDNVKHE